MEENEKMYLDWDGLQEYHLNIESELSLKVNSSDLANVATSGDYSDLNNTPTNVSLFTNDAGYLTSEIDNTNGHEYVEIGGLKWATMNIGATNITDIGLYFQWGDILGYTSEEVGVEKNFTWNDYKFNPSGDGETFTKYNSSDEKISLDLEDDPVASAWGSDWRTPTSADFQTFSEAVDTEWVSDYLDSGVSGLLCTDKEDSTKTIFFPAGGFCSQGSIIDEGGLYWTKSLANSKDKGIGIGFDDSNTSWNLTYNRCLGYCLRGILNGPNKRTVMGVTLAEKNTWNNKIESVTYVNKTFVKTTNGINSNIVTTNTLKTDLELKKSDVGLENVTNDSLVKRSEMGTANGVATLDSVGKITSTQLPDYVMNIDGIVPSQATSSNQLADKNFVNSSISTSTATFRGTSATGLTEQQFLTWANSLTKDDNDYVFWNTVDSDGNTLFKRYKYDGTQWVYEYTLNNSSFTSSQWAAIQSGITSNLVDKLTALPTNANLTTSLGNKADKTATVTNVAYDTTNKKFTKTINGSTTDIVNASTVVSGGIAVVNNTPTLDWNTTSTIGSVQGTELKVKLPANPNTWRGILNNLTSTSTSDSLSAYQGYLLANGSARDNTKLPLTGGTITTNDLNLETNLVFTKGGTNQNRTFSFKRTGSNTNIDVSWDWANKDGAGMALRSVDFSGQSGYFCIWARDSAGTTTQLEGRPDGTLTWGGNTIWTAGNLTNLNQLTNGPGYITSAALGNYVTLATAQEISGIKTFQEGKWLLKANEENAITSKYWNNQTYYKVDDSAQSPDGNSIRNAIRFRWYNTYWNIGNIRDSDMGSKGFGIGLENSSNTHILDCLRVTTEGTYICGNLAIHAGNYSSYALPLSGGTLTGNVTIKASSGTPGFYVNTNANTRIAYLGSGSSTPGSGSEHSVLQLFHNGSDAIRLYAAPNANSWINNGGNFGIGTDSPSYKLHVEGVVFSNQAFLFKNDASLKIYSTIGKSGDTETVAIQSCIDNVDPETSSGIYTPTNLSDRCVISLQPRGGCVGIGTTTPSYTLHVNGDVGATNFYVTSDHSKKTNIEKYSEHISKFTLKETGKNAYGVIAQDIPEMFRNGEEGSYTVDYNSVLSYYVGTLENKVKMLEEKLAKIEKEISNGKSID